MKKNDRIIGTCQGYTHDGNGVVKQDGFPIFVKDMCNHEEGEIIITQARKNFAFGKLHKLIQPSKQRVQPQCPIAKQCGGCQLQHMSYQEQLAFKKQKVQDVMQRIGKLDVQVEDVLGMEKPWNYRNKGQIPVGIQNGKLVTGFYRINSNTIIDMNTCAIQSERINEVLQVMKKLLNKYHNAKAFRHLLVKDGFASGEVMVVWIVNNKYLPKKDAMCRDLVNELPYIKSVILNINKRSDNVILGREEYVLYGDPYIYDKIHDLSFNISSQSFYQVNPVQTTTLYNKALEFAQLSGDELVIDLYCGVGTISMFLAKQARKVIGVEIVSAAIKDAKANAKRNGLDNVDFVCSDASIYASKLQKQGVRPDVVVVDPPRKGCDDVTLASIVKMNPKRIVYVSCDPATLARDLRYLSDQGYEVRIVQPCDMFPHSFHVENVVQLVRKEN